MLRLAARIAMSFVLAALAGLPAFAQAGGTPFPVRQFFASDYGQWSIPSQTANTFLWSPPGICKVSPPTAPGFLPFNTNAPVFIVDATAANSELLTPSAVTNTASQCGITISPANQHYSFQVISGTAGLQEALNQIPSTVAFPVQVVLDRNWYTLITEITGQTAAAAINSAAGSLAAYLTDVTVTPAQNYSWNGTSYTPSAANGTAPAFTSAGTGAGTGASGAIVAGSTGTSGYVTLTTGTTPAASGIIFTLTWPAIASGGFQYAPSCTVTSIGTTHAYTSGTVTTTAGAPATLVLTASATAMTASVSGYKFKYVCH